MSVNTLAVSAMDKEAGQSLLARHFNALSMAASRAIAVGLQLITQVVVGWLSGPAGLGVLQLFTSWTCIAGEILARGLPTKAMRVTAVAWEQGDTEHCSAQLKHSGRAILRLAWLGIPVALLAYLAAASSLEDAELQRMGWLLLAVMLSAPIFALIRLASETLKATDATLQAISLENLVLPVVVLIVGFACWLAWKEMPVAALLVAGLAGFALTIQSLWATLDKRLSSTRQSPLDAERVVVSRVELRALWANSVFSIVFMHLPFLLLPWFASAEDIGVFAVAHKLINVITTLLILLASVFGPVFARAAASNDDRALSAALRKTQWISLAIYIPLVVVLLLAGDLLTGLFNLPAQSLYPYLLALASGQLINAATGLPGVLLNMVGEARRELKSLLLSLLLALSIAPFVGHMYGAIGIAWLFSASLACKNLISLGLAWRHLKNRRTTL